MMKINEISPLKLSKILKSKQKIYIIDVREQFEWDICHIKDSEHIPMNLIEKSLEKISKHIPTVIVCHHGIRSKDVIRFLEKNGYNNLLNLSGGIDYWAQEIEPSMPKY